MISRKSALCGLEKTSLRCGIPTAHAGKDVMLTAERYLHFDNIDMSGGQIVSCCIVCGMEFGDAPRPGEHVDELLLRIRASFDAHD